MVFIQPHYWRSIYIDQLKDIVVNSNCDKVELFVNGASKGYKLLDKSNFHSVTFNNIRIEPGAITAVATGEGKSVKTEIVMAERAAKIVLKGSQNRISADRGNVVIITADIQDSHGNHVYGANNTIKWTLTGPATLVGPAIYETDINRHQMQDGVWYMDMPVSNVIRSTGKPGKINISVSASGLTSGSFDIETEEMVTDNSVVSEPVLQNEGRIGITKVLLTPNRLEEVPHEIILTINEINLGNSDKTGYFRLIRDYIKKNNPAIDTATIELRTLSDLFAGQLLNSAGKLIADDYNFSINHFNNCRLISRYINSTKLPPLFKDGLKKYYSDAIIMKGSEKDAVD